LRPNTLFRRGTSARFLAPGTFRKTDRPTLS
jgi:hypothetical protein